MQRVPEFTFNKCENFKKLTHGYLKKITEGYHAVRRSDRFWSGLWSDLVIEQNLMRFIKD